MLFAIGMSVLGKTMPEVSRPILVTNMDQSRPANNVFIFLYGIAVKGPKMCKILVRMIKLLLLESINLHFTLFLALLRLLPKA